jgi:CO dehydrogenase/acetyl-CoA synthase beta subunit
MAMKLVKKTDEYSIYLRGDKRYAVEDARKKPVNGEEKVRILVAEELLKVAAPAKKEEPVAEEAAAEEAPAEEAAEVEAEAEESAEVEAAANRMKGLSVLVVQRATSHSPKRATRPWVCLIAQ